MNDARLIFAGAILLTSGFAHQITYINQLDRKAILFLHAQPGYSLMVKLARITWLLGTSPIFILLLITYILIDFQKGLFITVVYGITALIERGIKIIIGRKRPFEQLASIKNQQPRVPHDPSFPSGDCLRIWYIVLTLGIFIPLSTWMMSILILIAIWVSLGRMILGVHFLTDVVSGTGLGILAAGIAILIS